MYVSDWLSAISRLIRVMGEEATGTYAQCQAACASDYDVPSIRHMPKRSGKKDFNQEVHAIFEHVAAGESPTADGEAPAPPAEPEREKDPAAVSLGRRGGLKGGRARMDAMTPEERAELGRKAAAARWRKGD